MADVTVRPLLAQDWQIKRDLRLEALREAPHAFLSTLDREIDRDDVGWREWGTSGALFGAWLDGQPVGIAGAYLPADPHTVELFGMWVAPAARGRGVAGLLADAVLDWARERDMQRVCLEVAPGNDSAARAYERAGFQPSARAPRIAGGATMEFALR
jgi:RimJ/RimL family protein N-acetyltransferase